VRHEQTKTKTPDAEKAAQQKLRAKETRQIRSDREKEQKKKHKHNVVKGYRKLPKFDVAVSTVYFMNTLY
jgi:PAB1-binding protein PBP1